MRTSAIGILGFILLASPSVAATRVGPHCSLRKAAAVGKLLHDVLKCHAIGAQHGVPENPPCVTAAQTALTARFTKLDATGTCYSTGDAATLVADADTIVALVRIDLPRPTAPSRCSAARLSATGRLLGDEIHVHARDKVHPNASLLAAMDARIQGRFAAAFVAAASLGDCLPADVTPTAAADNGQALVVTTLFSRCGDDAVNRASEQCDGRDDGACHGLCHADCTCPAPVCGNGVVEAGEGCEVGASNCATIGAQCGAPGSPAACQCCLVGGSSSDGPLPCCTGGVAQLQGPHYYVCDAICGNGILELGETCEPGTSSDMCPLFGLSCGPTCQCCIPPGGTSCIGLGCPQTCCDGSQLQIDMIDRLVSCPVPFTGRCDPPSVCQLGTCQPDFSCCADAPQTPCISGLDQTGTRLLAVPCCAGLACRDIQVISTSALVVNCCVPDGAACTSDGACCTGHCTGGTCAQCLPEGSACATRGECCSSTCTDGTCTACGGPSAFCFDGVQCCSGVCNKGTEPIGGCQ